MADIEAGQTWRPSRSGSRAKARYVVWSGDVPETWKRAWHPNYPTVGWTHNPENPGFPETGHDSWVHVKEFLRWAKRHDARPA
jgi:hypothetical protein